VPDALPDTPNQAYQSMQGNNRKFQIETKIIVNACW